MASAWTEDAPIALPNRSIAYGAGIAVLLLAVTGLGMGFETASRKAAAPELNGAAGPGVKDDALIAKPIVDLAPPTAAPDANKDDSDDADDEKNDAAIAAQTAAAQAIQSKPSKAGGDIDDVLTSPSEKPPAPAKAPADEAPPGAPVKSDVPF